MYIKGVESDGSNMLKNLSAAFADTNKNKEIEEKIDPNILVKNTQLKVDCYNNLSGNITLKTSEPFCYCVNEIITFWNN